MLSIRRSVSLGLGVWTALRLGCVDVSRSCPHGDSKVASATAVSTLPLQINLQAGADHDGRRQFVKKEMKRGRVCIGGVFDV